MYAYTPLLLVCWSNNNKEDFMQYNNLYLISQEMFLPDVCINGPFMEQPIRDLHLQIICNIYLHLLIINDLFSTLLNICLR